ncbi:MAG: polyprenyl synthetase family protein [Alphaproteobacteria bacterium]|nr:polyprenyl synthetase family protein [Alphaproteobacteria bacterium SS10]
MLQQMLREVEALMLDLATTASAGSTTTAEAVREHFAAGGKRIRALMALDAGQKLQIDEQSAVAVAACCELLHNASLVHDDIQDQDLERRNRPSLWATHGAEHALCAGDLMLSAAYAALAHVDVQGGLGQLLQRTYQAVARTINGQTADIEQRGQKLDDFTLYETIASEKSGPLLGLPIELSLVIAGQLQSVEVLNQAVRSIAIAYQLVDDLGDIAEDAEQGAMNGVWVLAEGHENNIGIAIQEAATTTRQHLDFARRQAAMLHGDCGAVLASLADRLEAKLKDLLADAP